MRVRVYWNLHKKIWSIQCCKTNNVVAHAQTVQLDNAKFVVRKAGQRKVRETGQKNVHAFAVGELRNNRPDKPMLKYNFYHECDQVTYNPHTMDTFGYIHSEDPVDAEDYHIGMFTVQGKPEVYAV